MTPQAMSKAREPDFQLVLQVRELRRLGYCVNDICWRLNLHKESDRAAVQRIIKHMGNRYQFGELSIGGPIKQGRSSARMIRP